MDKNRNSKIASKVNAQNQKQCNSTQDMAKQRISEFEGISMETSKTKICKEKKRDRILPNCGTITKCVNIMYNGNIRNNSKENEHKKYLK